MSLVYPEALNDLWKGDINADAVSIRALLLKDTYAPDLSHDRLDDISAGHRIGSAVALTGVSIVDGALQADPVVFASVAAGSTAKYVLLYIHTGTESTSRLIVVIDSIYQFPYETTGGNITINWPTSGIARLIQ